MGPGGQLKLSVKVYIAVLMALSVDRPCFAGADTLATSYALSMAIRKIKEYDIILCGRQAIDGDTAQ
jgi:electron transfer flavoprotein beta subunit